MHSKRDLVFLKDIANCISRRLLGFTPEDGFMKKPKHLFLNNQPDALIIQFYSVLKLRASLPIISSFLLYIRHW
jgi:hypothetical protein